MGSRCAAGRSWQSRPQDSAADYVAACRATESQLPAMAACCHAGLCQGTGIGQITATSPRSINNQDRAISPLNADPRLLEPGSAFFICGSSTSNHDEPQTHGFGHRIRSPCSAQFCHDGGDVELGRVRRYAEVPGNGFVRFSFRQQPQHLQFSRGELDRRRLILARRFPEHCESLRHRRDDREIPPTA